MADCRTRLTLEEQAFVNALAYAVLGNCDLASTEAMTEVASNYLLVIDVDHPKLVPLIEAIQRLAHPSGNSPLERTRSRAGTQMLAERALARFFAWRFGLCEDAITAKKVAA